MKPPDSSNNTAPRLSMVRTMPALAALPLAESASQHCRARLVSPANAMLNIELEPGITRVGRQRDANEIVLVSPQISRRHAELRVHKGKIWLHDVGSVHGTSVNGQRITTRRLLPGDRICFADEFMFWLLVELEPRSSERRTLEAVSKAPVRRQRASMGSTGMPAHLQRQLDQFASSNKQPRPIPTPQPVPPFEPTELEVTLNETISSTDELRGAKCKSWEVTNELDAGEPFADVPDRAPGSTTRRTTWEVTNEEVPLQEDLVSGDSKRRHVDALLQLHKRCKELGSHQQVEALLVEALARTTSFERGFLAYALPSGDWRLVTSPAGQDWARDEVLELIRLSTRLSRLSIVANSAVDPSLGRSSDGRPDSRLLLPLHDQDIPVGAVFLIGAPGAFTELTADFLELFAQVATTALLDLG